MHVCPVARCQRSFKRRFNLLRHVHRVHPTPNQHHDIPATIKKTYPAASSQSVDQLRNMTDSTENEADVVDAVDEQIEGWDSDEGLEGEHEYSSSWYTK